MLRACASVIPPSIRSQVMMLVWVPWSQPPRASKTGTARLTIESTSRFASSANRRNSAISGSGSRSKSASTYSSSSANDTATTHTPDPRLVHREERCLA